MNQLSQRSNYHWFLGDLADFQSQPLAMLLDLADNYGPLTQIRFGAAQQLVLTHPDAARHVLQTNQRNYHKEQQFMAIARMVFASGDNLFTSDDNPWLHRRRLMQPAFHRRIVANFGTTITALAIAMIDGWQSNQTVDMESAMMAVTMSVIGHTMISQDILIDHPHFYDNFTTTSEHIIHRSTTILGRMTPLWVPTKRNRTFRRALAQIQQSLQAVVAARLAQPLDERPMDLLTMLIAGHDDESGFTLSPLQLADELFGIVSAGHETSSVTLAWLFYELAHNPAIDEQLYAELQQVVGDRLPTVEDLSQLPYLQAVINETMRRYPAAYLTSRQAVAADTIMDVPVKAGGSLIVNFYGLHHHRDYWQEPLRFQPSRWLEQEAIPFTFLPFGEGPRKCIGEPLARTEMALIAVTVLQRYRLLPAARPSELIARFTLRARDGVWLRVVARS